MDTTSKLLEASGACGISSGNDADNDGGYVTAVGEHQQPTNADQHDTTVITVNRTWWGPKQSERFMMCADAEDTFSKANQRALGLRSQKKSELLSRARSKLRTTSTHHSEEEKQEKPRDVMESSNATTTDKATLGI